MARDKREQLSSGRGIKPRYITSHNQSAANVGLFNEIEYNRDDAAVEGNVPWRYTDAHMVVDEREEAMQGGMEQVYDHIKAENARMMTALIELSETNVWSAPSSTTDNATPWGVDYWVTTNATLGFNGGNHASFSAGRAGISSGIYSRYKNFTGAYTTTDDAEDTGLIWMMNRAADQCKWISAAPEPGMGRTGYSKMGIYANWKTKQRIEKYAKTGNDMLGWDVGAQRAIFRGAEIKYSPYHDSDTTNPVLQLNHNYIYAIFLKGWFMKRITINRLPNQPHCTAALVSLAWNMCSDDPRRQARFYEA
jgi:hypothetical protein